jgi:hypothetical protein
VKTKILTSHNLLQEAERELKAARPANSREALERVLELVREQRRLHSALLYAAVDHELALIAYAGPEQLEEFELAGSADREISFSLRMGARKIGELRVGAERELSYADDALLRRATKLLARFLTSTAKVLVRHAREAREETTEREAPRKVQPASEKERALSTRKAAVGAAARR